LFVGSVPCFEDFSLGPLVSLPPQKSTFLNSNLIIDRWLQVYQFIQLSQFTLIKQRFLFFYQNKNPKGTVLFKVEAPEKLCNTT
jgi:hypothetical protein